MTATFSDTHVRLAMTGHWNGFTNWTTELFSVPHVCPQKQCVSFITVLSKANVTWSGRKIVVQHKSFDCPPFIQGSPVVLRGPKRNPNNRFSQFAPKSEESVTATPPSSAPMTSATQCTATQQQVRSTAQPAKFFYRMFLLLLI